MMTYEIEFQGDNQKKNIVYKNTTDLTRTFFDDWAIDNDTTSIVTRTLKNENGIVLGLEQIKDEPIGFSQGFGYKKSNFENTVNFTFSFVGTGVDFNMKNTTETGTIIARLFDSNGKGLKTTILNTVIEIYKIWSLGNIHLK